MRALRFSVLLAVALFLLPPARAAEKGIAWEKSVATALERAKKEKKAVVVDFWATWCGWCKVQDREIFEKQKFVDFSRNQVYLKLDTEDGGEGTELASRFGVASLPTILVMDADGKEMDRIPGFLPIDDFMAALQQILDGKGEFQQLARKQDATSEEYLKLAYLYLERNDADGAIGAFTKVMERDPSNRDGFADDALLYMGRLALALGKNDDAKRHFRQYLERYPQEQGAPQVKEWLAALGSPQS